MSDSPPYQGELSKGDGKIPVGADQDALSLDSDAAKLAGMGYTQEMERGFSKWSLLGGKLSIPPRTPLILDKSTSIANLAESVSFALTNS